MFPAVFRYRLCRVNAPIQGVAMSNELTRTYRPFSDSRPYTRWWWFYDDIKVEDVRIQLKWVRDQGFGGVEIAFMYPQPGAAEGPRWLSEAWTDLVCLRQGRVRPARDRVRLHLQYLLALRRIDRFQGRRGTGIRRSGGPAPGEIVGVILFRPRTDTEPSGPGRAGPIRRTRRRRT